MISFSIRHYSLAINNILLTKVQNAFPVLLHCLPLSLLTLTPLPPVLHLIRQVVPQAVIHPVRGLFGCSMSSSWPGSTGSVSFLHAVISWAHVLNLTPMAEELSCVEVCVSKRASITSDSQHQVQYIESIRCINHMIK